MKKFFYPLLVVGLLCGVNVPNSIASTPTPVEIAAPQADDWNDNGSDDGWNDDNNSNDDWNDNGSNDSWNDNSSDDNWNDNSSNDSWNDNESESYNQSSSSSGGLLNGIGSFFSTIAGIILMIVLLPVIIVIVVIVCIKSKIEERRAARKAKKEGKTETKEQRVVQAAAVSSAVSATTTENKNNAASQYKVRVKGVVHGPYTYNQMCNFIHEGRMNLNTEVMKRGDNTWRPASYFAELAKLLHSSNHNSSKSSLYNDNQYKVKVKGEIHGPYSYNEMCDFARSGKLKKQTMVMRKGTNGWKNASEYDEFDRFF